MSDPVVTDEYEFPIRTSDGELVAIKHRKEFDNGTKTFWYSRPDGRPGLEGTWQNRLPLYMSEKVNGSEHVVIVEGEKKAEALEEVGIIALGSAGASNIPDLEHLDFLRNKNVVLWPDNDDAGHKHMREMAARLHTVGVASIRMVNTSDLPPKGDACDVEADLRQSYIDSAEEYVVPAHERVQRGPHVYTSHDLRTLFVRRSEKQWEYARTGKRIALQWGFNHLDTTTTGMQPGLITLHGKPGSMKSAFALQVAQQVQAPVLYVTAEMSIIELWRRVVSRTTRTPRRSLLSAMIDPEVEQALFDKTIDQYPMFRFIDAVTSAVRASYLRETVRDMQRMSDDGHVLLIVDSLHAWVGQFLADHPDVKEVEGINSGIRLLRGIATELHIPVLIIAERNRLGMDGGLSAVRGSGQVEYRSDIVMSIDKSEDQSDTHGNVVDMDISVLKNREGSAGITLHYAFTGDYQSFVEL